MTRAQVIRQATTYGRHVALGRGVLPDLALICVKAASKGEITSHDAAAIYMAFIQPLIDRGLVMSYISSRVQPSKLRQIILLGQYRKRQGVNLIQQAIKDYAAITLSCRRDKIRKPAHSSLYEYMVFVARNELNLLRASNAVRLTIHTRQALREIRRVA